MPHDVIGLLLEATKKHPERTAITQGKRLLYLCATG